MAEEPQDSTAARRFRPERVLILPVLVTFLGSLPLAASVSWLGWIVLLPVAAGIWVLRAVVIADPTGLTVSNGIRRRRWAWPAVTGFDVPRHGPVRLLAGGRRIPLTALRREQLRQVMALAGPH